MGSPYGRSFDRDSVSAGRFIIHLRYFFIRLRKGEQLAEGHYVRNDPDARTTPPLRTW